MMLTDRKVIALPLRTHTASCPQVGTGAPNSAAIYNLSARLQAQQYQLWLTMIVESSNDAIIGTSLDGIILSWNQAAKRLFGYSTVKVIDEPVTTLFSPQGADEVQLLIARSGHGELIDGHEMECIRENGQQVWVSLAFSPIKNKTGTIVGVAMIARDITQRKRAEHQLHHLSSNKGPVLMHAANSDLYDAKQAAADLPMGLTPIFKAFPKN